MVEIPASTDISLIDLFPYPSLLVSNDIPTNDEIEEIKTFLVEPTKRVQQTEAEIASLQARLDLLRTENASLKQQVETCRSSLTIVRRLPDDILLEIFFRCLPERSSPTMDATAAPSLLTAVCCRWRTLALQTRTLWSKIYIPIEDAVVTTRSMSQRQTNAIRQAYQQNLCTKLSMWLARSGTCPLTFILCIPSYHLRLRLVDHERTTYTKCLQILLSCISRWQKVVFEGKVELLSTLLKMPAQEFQSLESLYLDLLADPLPDGAPILRAPRLLQVSIKTRSMDPTTLHFPWAQLTHLNLRGDMYALFVDISDLSTFLSHCTTLIYLGIDVNHIKDRFGRLYLPNLQRMCVRQRTPAQISNTRRFFSEWLDAPLLRHITLQDFDKHSFSDILKRHGQSITILDFNTPYIDFKTFAGSLTHCPSLESLCIIRTDCQGNYLKIDKKFFRLFTPNDAKDSGPLCPVLWDFRFENIGCETLDGILSFLKGRQKGVPPRPIKISTAFVREGDKGDKLSNQMVQRLLKPFTDSKVLSNLWICDRLDRDRMNFDRGSTRAHTRFQIIGGIIDFRILIRFPISFRSLKAYSAI